MKKGFWEMFQDFLESFKKTSKEIFLPDDEPVVNLDLDLVLRVNGLPTRVELVGKKIVKNYSAALITAVYIYSDTVTIVTGDITRGCCDIKPLCISRRVNIETLKFLTPLNLEIA